ncbi:hypothetical protein [Escherichia phage AV124]|nr:hypothetical protein [Escherichia phage AV124]
MINISIDKLSEIIQKAGDEKYGVNDFYFIGQYDDGRYYGVLSTKVKSRSSAAQLRSPEFFEQKGIKAIKVMKRKKG